MLPERIQTEEELDELLSRPTPALVEMMKRLPGDLMVLGVAGKMGLTLIRAACRAIAEAGVRKQVYGVSRFTNSAARAQLDALGIHTLSCDLLDPEAVAQLPPAANIIFMAGRKFGTVGEEDATWASNTVLPGNVCRKFRGSRIVAFSTGCVYPLVEPVSGGCDECVPPAPIGEYAQSCLGRERIFQYASKHQGTPVCLLRLNYAIDLRYGVLHDIARQIVNGEPVNATVPNANVIWQGDANCQALLALEHCTAPANILNITGPETFAVADVARETGRLLGKPVKLQTGNSSLSYLNNAARAAELFGYPTVPLRTMIRWTADWVGQGKASLNKPTHFEVNTGKF